VARKARSAPATHHVEELDIRLRRFHVLEHHLHRADLVHVVYGLPENPGLFQDVRGQQQFLAARAAAVELDRREDALLVQAAVQVDLGVADALGALEQPPTKLRLIGLCATSLKQRKRTMKAHELKIYVKSEE
jgi:hypothetical protein